MIYVKNIVTATFNNSCKNSFFHELCFFLNILYNSEAIASYTHLYSKK